MELKTGTVENKDENYLHDFKEVKKFYEILSKRNRIFLRRNLQLGIKLAKKNSQRHCKDKTSNCFRDLTEKHIGTSDNSNRDDVSSRKGHNKKIKNGHQTNKKKRGRSKVSVPLWQSHSQVTEQSYDNNFQLVYVCIYEDSETGLLKDHLDIRKKDECLWCDHHILRSDDEVNLVDNKDTNLSAWNQPRQQKIKALLIHLKNCHLHYEYHSVGDENGNVLILVERNRDADLEQFVNLDPKLINRKGEKCRELQLRHFKIPLCKPLEFLIENRTEIRQIFTNIDINANINSKITNDEEFYHPRTGIRMVPEELSLSNDEIDDSRELMQRNNKIDEFDNLMYEEKEMMKLWNIHVFNYPHFGDGYFGVQCEHFVKRFASVIVKMNLRHHALLHFLTCSKFGLLNIDEILLCMAVIDRAAIEN